MKLSFEKMYFKQYIREAHYVHEPSPATYQTFSIDGDMYFQLDCYNKNVNLEKNGTLEQSTQKIQFDKETARQFIALLKKELSI